MDQVVLVLIVLYIATIGYGKLDDEKKRKEKSCNITIILIVIKSVKLLQIIVLETIFASALAL